MMRLLRIARTEVLEHRRQPWMVFILATSYLVWIGAFGGLFLYVGASAQAGFEQQLATFGVSLEGFLRSTVSSFGALIFTNLPLFVAYMSGASVLHDREAGTMPFLMLAPITRRHLLVGKLAGAMAIPLVLHFVLVGPSTLLLGQLELLTPYSHMLGGSAAWWLAYLIGAPASAAFVGALGTVISALSRDMRTSMQYTSFFIGLLSLGIAYVLIDGISKDTILLQLVFTLGCLVAAALTLLVGARLISTDVTATT